MKCNWETTMKSTEFKRLRLAVSELDHQQRKQLLETLAHQRDEVQVTERIESSFDGKKACPHCHSVKLYRFWGGQWIAALSLSRLQKNFQRIDQDTVSPFAPQGTVAQR
jgi:hypothetical protein